VTSGRSQWHLAKTQDQIDGAWKVLIDLHQRRRNGLGEPGCFASKQFHDFHREAVERLFAAGQLRLSWIELDGKPFTTEYHLSSPNTVFTYQSGMDISRLNESPGRLAYMLTIQRAIEEGFKQLDFLRGDEPYKSHWRAQPQPIFDYRVFPNRRLARLRGHLMQTAMTLKEWMKQGVASVCG
jgi:CelD/BcsL family acetyltransferase involved in cellulose biosynthesis